MTRPILANYRTAAADLVSERTAIESMRPRRLAEVERVPGGAYVAARIYVSDEEAAAASKDPK